MSKTNALKDFFKKFLNINASGNSPISVLNDVMVNNDSIGGGSSNIMIINGVVNFEEQTLELYDNVTWSQVRTFIDNGGMVFLCVSQNIEDTNIKFYWKLIKIKKFYVRFDEAMLIADPYSADGYLKYAIPPYDIDELHDDIDEPDPTGDDDEPQGPPVE